MPRHALSRVRHTPIMYSRNTHAQSPHRTSTSLLSHSSHQITTSIFSSLSPPTSPLLAHPSEKVHDALRTARTTLLATIAIVCVLELPTLLQHALALLLAAVVVVVAAHALWVRRVMVVLLSVLEFRVVGGLARGTAGRVRVAGVGEFVVANGCRGGWVIELGLVGGSGGGAGNGVGVAYPAGAVVVAIVEAGPHVACAGGALAGRPGVAAAKGQSTL
jgi:hypothetical protein